jgi:hypothetical protein
MNTSRELARWVATWQAAGPALEEQKRLELESIDTPTALRQLAAAFALARTRGATRDTSGLVEQQREFGRLAG